VTAKFLKTIIITSKQKSLAFNMKLEIMSVKSAAHQKAKYEGSMD
jgi:hypothetical protein